MARAPDPGAAPLSRFDAEGRDPRAAVRAAALLKVLAHEGRLEVLCQLIEGELSVGEIEAALGMPQTRVSQLLMRLRAEGIVEARREGRHMLYRLARPEIAELISALRRAF